MDKKKAGFLVVALIAALVIGMQSLGPGGPTVPEGQPMSEVIVPSLSEEALQGQAIFTANCAVCHGVNAIGLSGLGPSLINPIYRPAHHADIAIALAAKLGVRAHHWNFGSMPPMPAITEAELLNITVYIRELQRANGIE